MTTPPETSPPVSNAYDFAACGLLTTTVEGLIVRANPAFCRWVGWEAGDLVGQRWLHDFLTIGAKVFQQTHWAPLLQMQRSVAEVKLEIVGRDKQVMPMLINAFRHEYEGVEYDEYSFVVVADRHRYEQELVRSRRHAEVALEEKKRAEEALKQADERKDVFLATLAHELRNPISPMKSVVEAMQLKGADDSDSIWSLGVLSRQLTHLTHLVDDLLEVSRINEGKIVLRKTRLDLSTAMRYAVANAQGLIDSAGHTVEVSYPAHPVYLDADATRLSQIFTNLLNNAAKYTPDGGHIRFAGELDGDGVLVTVRDSGIGIAADNLARVFEMFSQLPSGQQRAQGGLGIGLSLVRTLTQLHGGSVSVRSEGERRGSEFSVRLLACADQQSAGSDAPPAETGSIRPMRVLIVDDNEDAAISLSLLLEMEGHSVETVSNGLDAVTLASQLDPDAMIVDIGLPGISGYEVARRIRANAAGRPMLLIALTGWGQARDKDEAKAAGFDLHFTKPVDLDRLRAALGQRESNGKTMPQGVAEQ